jgi:SAM-dependent MidA family methyltransferase
MGYPVRTNRATLSLRERLTVKIRGKGPISFADFMACALYDPDEGYYARDSRQVGKGGDFFTSVSTGPVFGRLLAEKIARWHRGIDSPKRWRVVELGAHDGSLALDILNGLKELGLHDGCDYEILEPLASLAAMQRHRFVEANARARVRSDAAELENDPLPTYLLANEVLDALPFHVIESDGACWREMGVAVNDEGVFQWSDLGPADSAIVSDLPSRAKGYRTEVRPHLKEFLTPLSRLLAPGRMLWIDYGFPRSIYYDEARTSGTLRTYHLHRAGEDPLDAPGEKDITAHVDFTAAAGAISALGGVLTLFEDQGRCLTHLARDWLMEREGRTDPEVRKELLAFQTLIHPAHLGGRFHLLEAAFGEDIVKDAAALARLEQV